MGYYGPKPRARRVRNTTVTPLRNKTGVILNVPLFSGVFPSFRLEERERSKHEKLCGFVRARRLAQGPIRGILNDNKTPHFRQFTLYPAGIVADTYYSYSTNHWLHLWSCAAYVTNFNYYKPLFWRFYSIYGEWVVVRCTTLLARPWRGPRARKGRVSSCNEWGYQKPLKYGHFRPKTVFGILAAKNPTRAIGTCTFLYTYSHYIIRGVSERSKHEKTFVVLCARIWPYYSG